MRPLLLAWLFIAVFPSLWFGVSAAAEMPQPVTVHAGPISAKFADGELRYLCAGGREIARRIYFAVRDDHWGTIIPVFTQADADAGDNSFVIKLEADCRSGAIDYSWKGRITGTPTGEITFAVEGVAHRDLRSNRIGLCVLFGAEALAGQKFATRDDLGQETEAEFPRLVTPVLLADKFRELHYVTAGRMQVTVSLQGGRFGMEDQRTYGDSSFKAFAPLGYPYPKVPGDALARQQVSLGIVAVPVATAEASGLRMKIGGLVPGARVPRLKEASLSLSVPSFETVNSHREKFAQEKTIAIRFNPTAHLCDDDALLENATTLLDQVRTIHSFAPGALVNVGPIGFESNPPGGPPDSRTETQFGAAWSARVLKTLALAGVDEAAFAVSGGPAQKMQRELGKHAGDRIVETIFDGSCHPQVDAICLESDGTRHLWLMNLTSGLQEVTLDGEKATLTLQPWEVRDLGALPENRL